MDGPDPLRGRGDTDGPVHAPGGGDADGADRVARRAVLSAATAGVAGLAGCVSGSLLGGNAEPGRRGRGRGEDEDGGGDGGDGGEGSADATFRGGLRRQGYYPDRRVPRSVSRRWRIPGLNVGDHTAAKASPVPAPDGDLVVAGDDGAVYRVTRGGEVVWAAATHPSAYGIHGTPTIADGTVYVGAYDGALYAFELATGRRRWRTRLGDAIGSSPAYRDGTVYVAVEYVPADGSVFAVRAADGRPEWEGGRPTDHPHSTLAIDTDAGKLVVGSNDGTLYAWEFPSLAPAWTFETEGAIKGPVAVHDGAAFFGSWDGGVYRVDLASGGRDWRFGADDMVMSGPAVDPGRGAVYVGSHDENLYALGATTGERRWAHDAGGWIIGCPVVTAEHVLVGAYDAALDAVRADTGEREWSAGARGRVTSTPLVADGAVYFADRATAESAGSLWKYA